MQISLLSWLLVSCVLLGRIVAVAEEQEAPPKDPATEEASAPKAEPARPAPKYRGIKQKFVNYREPEREYEEVPAEGWTIQVEKQLVTEEPELAAKAAARFGKKLNEALAAFPEGSHAHLKKVKIFLMYGSKAKGGGRDSGFEYFQPHAPDCYKTLDPRWGNSIVAYSAANYVWQSELWALKLPVHEMAHAWHLGQWPEDREEIVRAYDHAMEKELYRNVHTDQGEDRKQAYAIQNPLEYFAELSCMYFAECDYSPRNRRDLEAYDPDGYAMIRQLWGVKD